MKIGESATPENLDPARDRVHLLYEPGYVIFCVGKLTEGTPCEHI
jgi:hypothetical protein